MDDGRSCLFIEGKISSSRCVLVCNTKVHRTIIFVILLKISPTEAASVARCFKGKDFSAFMTSGVRVEEMKYNFLREEDNKLVLAKKKGSGAITLQSSKTAIVIAHCPEGSQQGNTNKGVAVIADYLESMNM